MEWHCMPPPPPQDKMSEPTQGLQRPTPPTRSSSTLEMLPPSPSPELADLPSDEEEDVQPSAPSTSTGLRRLVEICAPARPHSPGPKSKISLAESVASSIGLPGPKPAVWNPQAQARQQRPLWRWAMKRPPPEEGITISVNGSGSSAEPFAREVAIAGWQVVGGKDFVATARVGAYVVYEIEIDLRNGSKVTILRRYTEFVRLHKALCRAFPHLKQTIPPLPGKNHMSKFQPEFLEERRPRLQRFIRTVMLHPEMGVGGNDSVVGQWVLGTESQ
ncbi:PX domain-containing protein YPT35 [Vanrija pseudolonga]|uniref:Endosomal/vacuolar adapter protein YPT35 n=1 Tax=Vanrija pseudolonga TaxID=143232 RepID=A0AAF0Y651_9TREE|nr:PX domain-containing protein YPT35 [Vanrija pseudolonga]